MRLSIFRCSSLWNASLRCWTNARAKASAASAACDGDRAVAVAAMMSAWESGVADSEMFFLVPSSLNASSRTRGAFITRAAPTTGEEPSEGCLKTLVKPWRSPLVSTADTVTSAVASYFFGAVSVIAAVTPTVTTTGTTISSHCRRNARR